MSVNALAKALSVDATRMNEMVRKRHRVSIDTALRLARYFDTALELWLTLQCDDELKTVADSDEGRSILSQVIPREAMTA